MAKIIDTLSRIFKRKPVGDLKHITDAIDNSLNGFALDLKILKEIEFNIGTATGEWLDEWGSWFGVPRADGEKDVDYANRILALISKPKITIPAIEDSVRVLIGDPNSPVEIFEPSTHVYKFDRSTFSGAHKYQDGVYWRSAVIDILTDTDITETFKQTINDVKAGGVRVYYSKNVTLSEIGVDIPSDLVLYEKETYRELHLPRYNAQYPIFSSRSRRSGNQILFMDTLPGRHRDIRGKVSRPILASSQMTLDTIWNSTVGEVMEMVDETVQPIVREVFPV